MVSDYGKFCMVCYSPDVHMWCGHYHINKGKKMIAAWCIKHHDMVFKIERKCCSGGGYWLPPRYINYYAIYRRI